MNVQIGIAAWIIQDGNYPEFSAGQPYQFAMEFYAQTDLHQLSSASALEHIGGGVHRAFGQVVHVEPDVWVCDFGVLAYHSGKPPEWASAGVSVGGEVYLGVDHYSYKETFRRRPRFPQLTYDILLTAIALETTPWIESTLPDGRPCFKRDASRSSFRPVPATDAWHDDGGSAHYVLDCSILGVAA